MGCIELFNVGDTLGDVVTKFPYAATIFSQSQIDFCCGGARSIQQALDEKDLDASGFMLALNAAWTEQQSQDSVFINWQEAPLTKLVDHILQAHHAYLQQNMPKIGELSTKILRVHGEHHGQVLSTLHRQFHLFKMAMEECPDPSEAPHTDFEECPYNTKLVLHVLNILLLSEIFPIRQTHTV